MFIYSNKLSFFLQVPVFRASMQQSCSICACELVDDFCIDRKKIDIAQSSHIKHKKQ